MTAGVIGCTLKATSSEAVSVKYACVVPNRIHTGKDICVVLMAHERRRYNKTVQAIITRCPNDHLPLLSLYVRNPLAASSNVKCPRVCTSCLVPVSAIKSIMCDKPLELWRALINPLRHRTNNCWRQYNYQGLLTFGPRPSGEEREVI